MLMQNTVTNALLSLGKIQRKTKKYNYFLISQLISIIKACMSAFTNTNNNKLSSFRLKVSQGESLTDVDLSNCGLQEFPPELFATAHSIETLNLGGNLIKELPADLSPFTKLRILFFAQNRFTEYPVQLNQLPVLRMVSFKSNSLYRIDEEALTSSIKWLILTDNELRSIPRSIGKLTHLRKCMLAGNKLTSLPDEMAGCQELELLRLAANDLVELPMWLLKLPRLSWLAFAGNPLGSARTTAFGKYGYVCMYVSMNAF